MLRVNSTMVCTAVKIAAGPTGSLSDPYWSNVSLLLKGDGGPTLDGNSIQPIDNSPNGYGVTTIGTPKQRSFSPFSSGGSTLLNGSTDAYTVGVASNWTFLNNGSTWTTECWFYTTTSAFQSLLTTYTSSGGTGIQIDISNLTTGDIRVQFYRGVGGSIASFGTAGGVWSPNTWNHVAVTFDGSTKTCTIYVNGVQKSSSSNSGYAYSSSSPTMTLAIGRAQYSTPGSYFSGYITNVRTTNTLVYTSNFTTPTTPLSSITGTTLLMKFDGIQDANNFTYVDSSNNHMPLTAVGLVMQGSNSPFVSGGSIYQADASTDMLTFNANAGSAFLFTGDFTIEGWVKIPSGADRSIFTIGNGTTYLAVNMSLTAQVINVYVNAGSVSATYSVGLTTNTWYHFALVRRGSGAGNVKTYLNGVSVGSITNTSTLGYTNPSVARIGGGVAGVPQYVSNIRVVTSAIYTSNFTVPTTELSAVTGTVLLISGNNWQVGDSTRKFNLFSSGTPRISQSVVKFGKGSIRFDGSSRSYTASDSAFAFGAGNFTLETWIYITAYPSGTEGRIFQFASDDHDNFEVWPDGRLMYYDGTLHYSTNTIPLNQWNHVAFVRNGSTGTFYINGVSNGSFSTSYTSGNRACNIGWNSAQSVGNALVGYIDEARITKGIARYTSNFTPPTQAFPSQ